VSNFLNSLANDSDSGRKENNDCLDTIQIEISRTVLFILGYVIPVVYAKLISRKEQSITQLNVSNSCYVLDQQGNYMFRPLEAIFRLHK